MHRHHTKWRHNIKQNNNNLHDTQPNILQENNIDKNPTQQNATQQNDNQ